MITIPLLSGAIGYLRTSGKLLGVEPEGGYAEAELVRELTPDEARILRLLMRHGPQPAVDVQAMGTFGISERTAPLNMVGADAGCRDLDRVPAYLDHLFRLGLIQFSREPLDDPLDYHVLEAQPEVLARKRARYTKTVRRSIVLTPIGEDFCRMWIPAD